MQVLSAVEVGQGRVPSGEGSVSYAGWRAVNTPFVADQRSCWSLTRSDSTKVYKSSCGVLSMEFGSLVVSMKPTLPSVSSTR